MRAGEKTPRLRVHPPQPGDQEEVSPEGAIVKHKVNDFRRCFQVSRHCTSRGF